MTLADFDAIHTSPPCQGYTTMSNRYRGNGGPTDDHDQLIDAVRLRTLPLTLLSPHDGSRPPHNEPRRNARPEAAPRDGFEPRRSGSTSR